MKDNCFPYKMIGGKKLARLRNSFFISDFTNATN